MSVAEISEQLNLTSIKDHGWHIQASTSQKPLALDKRVTINSLSLKADTSPRWTANLVPAELH